ncbi:MAG: DUF72 domain-containing protein [Myxococcales bacterium]|nr:DUF72 domain-containing protein [Myxococcota bacterium]MDW8280923.1 DUF72 domain-containing protein [Myxococcales bacterium]
MARQLGLFADGEPARTPPKDVPRDFDPTTLPVPPKRGPARVRFGTSSWTYPGWQGQVFSDVGRYGSRFGRLCLGEYARDPRFRTAGADNLYYVAPRERLQMLQEYRRLVGDVPGFDLCPKVWHGITVHRYTPQQQATWRLNSEINRFFLDPQAFLEEVLWPLEQGLGPHLGPLILEVQENTLSPEAFAAALDRFLGAARARASFRLGVELRTRAHLSDRYLDVLSAHGMAHVLNAWTRMPPIGWQLQRLCHRLQWDLFIVRALLRPGTFSGCGAFVPGSRYDEAVEAFAPYDRIQVRLPQVRNDILKVVATSGEVPVYVLVNNRLEGCAPQTIEELQAQLWGPASDVLWP